MSVIRNLKEEWDRKVPFLQNKMSKMYGTEEPQEYNPFLDKDGNVFNPFINYQAVLDNPNVTAKAKEFITNATGLTPTPVQSTPSEPSVQGGIVEGGSYTPTVPTGTQQPSSYSSLVGTRITDTSKFNNNAALGQCVWYVRGRASEKLGVDPGSLGNAKDVWYNAPADKKVSATAENLKPNMIVSYASGPGVAAQYGHVIYIEDVVGDTVYYTEGGSTYYNKGTDGVVKTASRDGILNGKNSNGGTIGANVVGFIDMNKYK